MELICPLCSQPLVRDERRYICNANHSFDIAKQGYANLLPVQEKHSLHPGDTREQVLSRRAFLESGAYAPIIEALITTAQTYHAHGPILDVGCGEGYYSSRLADALNCDLLGIDISKEAVRCASAKYKRATWICATASHIPVPDHSIGTLTSLFALTMPEEFRRCLRRDGLYLQVLAAEDHLMGLKSIIYPEIKHKPKNTIPTLPGFQLLKSIPIRFSLQLEGEQVQNILYMTPHVYRISKDGLDRLRSTQQLTDTASCVLNVYRPLA